MNLSKQVLLESRLREIEQRKAEIAIIDQLPDGLNIQSFRLASAEAELCIDGNVNDTLEVLAPMAIHVDNDAVNGIHERSLARPAQPDDEYFPVWRLSAMRVRWFFLLNSGKPLVVTCTGDAMSLRVPESYQEMAGTHKTFFRRRG